MLFNYEAHSCKDHLSLYYWLSFPVLSLCFLHQVKASTPVLLCSVTGYDASGRVDDLATQQTKQCTSIAIGKRLKMIMN